MADKTQTSEKKSKYTQYAIFALVGVLTILLALTLVAKFTDIKIPYLTDMIKGTTVVNDNPGNDDLNNDLNNNSNDGINDVTDPAGAVNGDGQLPTGLLPDPITPPNTGGNNPGQADGPLNTGGS